MVDRDYDQSKLTVQPAIDLKHGHEGLFIGGSLGDSHGSLCLEGHIVKGRVVSEDRETALLRVVEAQRRCLRGKIVPLENMHEVVGEQETLGVGVISYRQHLDLLGIKDPLQ